VNQRLATMFNFYSYPTLRGPLADAWVRHVLAANADAEWVQARVEVLDIPSLEQLAVGKKAQWVEIGRHGAARGGAPVR